MFRRRTIKKRPGSAAPSITSTRCELEKSKLFLKQFLMLKLNGDIPESLNISVLRDWLIRREMDAFEKRYKQLLEKLEKKVIEELQEEQRLQMKIKNAISPLLDCPVQSSLTTIPSSGTSSASSSPNRERSYETSELHKETKWRREDVLQRDPTPPQTSAPDRALQVVSVPNKKKKWKRRLKDLNRKETGDVLDAFKEPPPPPKPEAPLQGTSKQTSSCPVVPLPVTVEEICLEKEDKPNAENVPSLTQATPTEHNYQYKESGEREGRKMYDREFLLGLQFISASKCKPEGLSHIRGVVLDKVNKVPLRLVDRSWMNCDPDFTLLFVDLNRQLVGGWGQVGILSGAYHSGTHKDPRRNSLSVMSLNGDIHLHKAENPWQRGGGAGSDDATQELLRSMQAVLNKMTPQMFQTLMKQMEEMSINTEERLKGIIYLVFEKAISEPNFAFIYANMCHCLMGLKVSTCDKSGVTVNFRKLLLNLCQKEFERDRSDDKTFKKKAMELDAATDEEVRQCLMEELVEMKDAARRRAHGNIKFIGELFKAKVLTENIIHDCVVKLLKNHDEESLESLCILLTTIGKDLDLEKTRLRLDLYFNLIKQIIKERWTSCRIRFKLQDLIDLRHNNWVPRRGDPRPKTIKQIHKDAEIDHQREQIKVQQRLFSVKVKKVPLSSLDRSRINCGPDFTTLFVDTDRQSVGGQGQNKQGDEGLEPSDDSWNTDYPSHLSKLSDRDTNHRAHTLNGSLSGDSGAPPSDSTDHVSKEPVSTPPPASSTPALSPEELEKKSTAIIEEYLTNSDMKEALQCVSEMNSSSSLSVFVRTGLELTLERCGGTREDMGSLLLQLLNTGTLTVLQYYKGLMEVLEVAEDMAVDVPHIWLYLAESITPVLREGGVAMASLFREVSKPLLPIGKAGDLLAIILSLLCTTTSQENVGAMWREAGLSWRDFLSEDEDVTKFIMEKGLHFTLDEEFGNVGESLSSEEISKQLDRLLQDKSDNQSIYTWVEAHLDEQQVSSCFVGALMTAVCQAAISGNTAVTEISQRAALLQHYITDQQMELQALSAIHSLMLQTKQSPTEALKIL